MSTQDEEKSGLDAIKQLKSTDPPLFLSPNSHLSCLSRIASQYLFTSLKPYCSKSPFEQLLTDGFDAEQIWQQIDLQSQPLFTTLKREIKRFEKDPDQILNLFGVSEANGVLENEIKENGNLGLEEDSEELSDEDEDEEDEDEGEDDEREHEEEDDEESDEEVLEDDGDGVPEVEDEFLKIKDLEKYLVREEKREYGSEEKKDKKKKKLGANVNDVDEDEAAESEEGEEDDEELMLYGGGASDEDGSEDNIRYEDFFVPNKTTQKQKRKKVDESDESEAEDEDNDDSEMEDDDEDEDVDDSKMKEDDDEQNKSNLSTYEREREKIQAKIKQMEAENLAPKDWTMQGEVSASKRPKDSALEVDLDFEHNIRPPPVITEEVTASLEEIIKKRILEIAPVSVSDAAMLAPEEVFSGKKVVKEENELTKEDRKKRRAKKKRKLKAINARKAASRAPEKPLQTQTEGKEE
ncbi:U3 small nucleolar ribonucleoprotein MPP10 [Bienertia sinuspersici]